MHLATCDLALGQEAVHGAIDLATCEIMTIALRSYTWPREARPSVLAIGRGYIG